MGIDGLQNLIEEGGHMQDEPKPVPEDLPEEGDPEDFEPEPIHPGDFDDPSGDDTADNAEELEEPNDLSGIEKEFED